MPYMTPAERAAFRQKVSRSLDTATPVEVESSIPSPKVTEIRDTSPDSVLGSSPSPPTVSPSLSSVANRTQTLTVPTRSPGSIVPATEVQSGNQQSVKARQTARRLSRPSTASTNASSKKSAVSGASASENATDSTVPQKRSNANPFSGLTNSKKKKNSAGTSPASPITLSSEDSFPSDLPSWYTKPPYEATKEPPSHTGQRQTRAMMTEAKKEITKFTRNSSSDEDLKNLRHLIHQLAVEKVSMWAIFQTKFFQADSGLKRIFSTPLHGPDFPWDLRSDAEELFVKWCGQKFDGDISIGIQLTAASKDKRAQPRLEGSYQFNKADSYGNNGLKNGAWFWNFTAARRDGAHGATMAGIHAGEDGAYSVMLSGRDYPNIDNGDVVRYCGTKNDDETNELKRGTEKLFQSIKTGKPIRLIRSETLPPDNIYRPSHGLRYDGLYVAQDDVDMVDHGRAKLHRFKLVRQPGQDPIRHVHDGTQRPTEEEVAAYQRQEALRKSKGET